MFSLPAMAQQFSAADTRLLKSYSTGIFYMDSAGTTIGAASAQPALKVQSLWPKRKDGEWLFVEKKGADSQYQVWHFYLQDDTTVLMQLFDFRNIQQAQQLSQDINRQQTLSLNNLLIRQGCELYLKKNKSIYTGTSAGKDCLANGAGAEYSTSTITLTKNSIAWKETFFDKDDKPLTENLSHFIKQVKSPK